MHFKNTHGQSHGDRDADHHVGPLHGSQTLCGVLTRRTIHCGPCTALGAQWAVGPRTSPPDGTQVWRSDCKTVHIYDLVRWIPIAHLQPSGSRRVLDLIHVSTLPPIPVPAPGAYSGRPQRPRHASQRGGHRRPYAVCRACHR